MQKKLLLLAAAACFATASAATDKVVCYYGSWAVYRPGDGKFDVENIDPNLCTHLIYTFVGISRDGSVRILDSWNDVDLAALKRFNSLKTGKKTKTLIAVGGWNEGSITFSQVCAEPGLRKNFVQSALTLVQTYGFDGFDLDWEYPARRGGSSADKQNFGTLTQEFRQEFDKYGYLLTAAVSGTETNIGISYDVPTMTKNLDFINIMAYDLHGSWEQTVGQNAPLYASSKDVSAEQKELNVDACITAWLRAGASANKLVLGIGVYGRTFNLRDASQTAPYSPSNGPGPAGEFTREGGMYGYNEICKYLKSGEWTEAWDEEQQVPYMYKGTTWVGYDNPKSVEIKVNYAKLKGLAGVMIWSIDTDDFKGACGPRYPILNAINLALGKDPVPTPSTESTASSGTSTTALPPANDECNSEGYIRDSNDCAIFYYCAPDGSGAFNKIKYQCAPGLYFDPALKACNYSHEVECLDACMEEGYIRSFTDCAVFYYCQKTIDGTFGRIKMQCASGLAYDPVLHICNYPQQVDCSNIISKQMYLDIF